LHTAAFVLPGQGGVPRALLVVTSTEGSHRNRVRWTETCPASRPRYFTNDYGTNVQPNRRDCLVVNAAFGAPAFYTAQRWSWLLDALAAKGWKLPKGGYSVRGVVGNDRATLLNVQLSTQKDFVGLNGAVRDATDLRETPQTLVVWGEALHEAMRTSV